MTRAIRLRTRPKEAAKVLLKLLVSAGLVALVIHKTGATGIATRLLDVNVPSMLVAATLMASLAVLPTLRWKILVRLSGRDFALVLLYKLLMISNFMAQAMPSIGADGLRAWYLYRQGMWSAAAVSSVLMDRLIALASLLLMSLVSLPWLWNIVTLARHLSSASRMLTRKPRALLEVVTLSLAVHLLVAIFIYGIARAVQIQVGLADCILMVPLVLLVATIPIGIAGWGMREGAMVVALGFLGIPPGDALLVSILFGIIVAVSTIPGLLFWLTRRHALEQETAPNEP
jgi:uncharacterized membrane protein YbhN (UPF0104 family)